MIYLLVILLSLNTPANVDYRLDQTNITFMPGTSSNCTTFTLIDDSLVEGNIPETIFVRIQSPDEFISFDTQSDIVSISIEDNDSKWYAYFTCLMN